MNKVDARIVNTKKFLKESLISLLLVKKLSAITIKDLCYTAEINRATFYSHYKSIEELFDEIISQFMSDIFSFISLMNNSKDSIERNEHLLNMIKYIDKNSQLFVMIFENSHNVDTQTEQYIHLKESIYEKIGENATSGESTIYLVNYYIYAGGAILYTWITTGKQESVYELSNIMNALITKSASGTGK